jgi:hypothetical protein
MTDSDITQKLHDAANHLNHLLSVAQHAGLHVQLTATNDPGLRLSDVYVARPVPPSKMVGPALLVFAPPSAPSAVEVPA